MRSMLCLTLVAALATPAAAKPFRPPPAPPTLTISPDAAPALAVVIRTQAAPLRACVTRFGAGELTIAARFDGRGRAKRMVVKSANTRLGACVSRALRAGRARGTRGKLLTATLSFGGVAAPTPARPAAPLAPPSLSTCKVDADCRLHFRTYACVLEDPVAVSSPDNAAVLAAFPIRKVACGIGGPDADRLIQANSGRFSAACVSNRCTVIDRGPQPTFP